MPMPPQMPVAPAAVDGAPAPHLVGDPDAVAIAPTTGSGRATDRSLPPVHTRRRAWLPAPRIEIAPPVRIQGAPEGPAAARPVARSPRAASRADTLPRERARTAADKNEWAVVLALAGENPSDPVLSNLAQSAHRWAHEQLGLAVVAVEEDRIRDALALLKVVIIEMHGQPQAIDAQRGLGAIQTSLELEHLDPQRQVAKTVRKNAHDEYRGTRWATLFLPSE